MALTPAELKRNEEAIHERARFFRGRFLNTVAVIEKELADILRLYFEQPTRLKGVIFKKHFLNGLSLSKKRDIFFDILSQEHPEFWADNQVHLRRLINIGEFRNKLAHSVLDSSLAARQRPVEEGVSFVDWQDGVPVTDVDFNEIEAEAGTALGVIDDARRLMPFARRD